MFESKLVAIDDGLFCVGMYINSGIYYRYQDASVLLCRNVLLTEELVRKLQQTATSQNGLYIDEAAYEEIWTASLQQHAYGKNRYMNTYTRVHQQYDRILSETVGLLGAAMLDDKNTLSIAQNLSTAIIGELKHSEQSAILNCINMIHAVDDYLYTHCTNVGMLNGMIGQWMGMSDSEINNLIQVGLLHDLGKLKISPQILNKPDKLTWEEFEELKYHPIYSYELLKESGETHEDVLRGVREHHEKINGQGYPDARDGEHISLFARITAISDIYDAMVSKRCYKEACTPFEVLAQFANNQFAGFDRHILQLFLENIPYLLIGMPVTLSDNTHGEVIFVNPHDYNYPIVRIDKRVIATNDTCKCVTVNGPISKNTLTLHTATATSASISTAIS